MGPLSVNHHADDAFEDAESFYLSCMWHWNPEIMRYRLPVKRGDLKFCVRGRWYSYTRTLPLLRTALELDKPEAERSQAASRFEKLLQAPLPPANIDAEHLGYAQPALLWVLKQLRPLPS